MVRAPIFAYVVLATVLAYKVKDKSSVPSAARVLVDELATIIENAWSYRYADTLVEAKNEHANAITDGMVATSMLAASLNLAVSDALSNQSEFPFQELHRFLDQTEIEASKLDLKYGDVTRRWLNAA